MTASLLAHRLAQGALCAALMVLAPAGPALGQARTIDPADEAAHDPTWIAFREELSAAVSQRDRAFLLGVLDEDVRAGLSVAPGIAMFRAQWRLDAVDSPLWDHLARALTLGAAFIEREPGVTELCAPYVLAHWPRDVDPFSHGVIVGAAVAVRPAPAADAPVLLRLSYEIVAVSNWEVADRDARAGRYWVRIRAGESEGYVAEEAIRTPIEHAACFVKTGNGWRLKALAPAGG